MLDWSGYLTVCPILNGEELNYICSYTKNMSSSVKIFMGINKIIIIFSLLNLFFVSFPAKARQCLALVLSGSASRPFWSKVVDGATQAGNELGYDIHVRGTINDNDSSGQMHILQYFIRKYQCNGVVIAPSGSAINKYVSQLKKQNIPTVYIDRDTGGERIATVKTDNYAAGKLAAQKMSEALGGHGKVVLFRLKEGVASTDARESGFVDEAKKKGIDIVADPYIGTRVGEARNRVKSTLLQLNEMDGIFTPNDTTTVGTILVKDSINIHKGVVHIGFDDSPIIVKSFKEEKLQGYITQSPYQMGYQGVYVVHKAIKGKLTKEKINTSVIYIGK
ncbi:substrate-binding domain-containing protein [Vibrio salinus]|uniref:substrate-binding domain-containing protein n=1 Tax=Vibrio salinus TaxID=2899784 RepID=UPI001E54F958|nr:substrate-binding domain-containing protein [Vibrio salinus]MCE0492625.1 substrate-binding domain-containing protein [Vibrio salinus]